MIQDNPTIYIPKFIEPARADAFFEMMLHIDWEQRPDAPRKEYWSNDFNHPYTYGRGHGIRTYQARPFPQAVSEIRQNILDLTSVNHEGCFCNRYDNQHDQLGWHSDDDPGIDHEDPISVVTLGQPRAIQWRRLISYQGVAPNAESERVSTVMLEHGSLFIMRPGMQFTHQHRIPKAGAIVGTRISLTYRSLAFGRPT